MNWQCAVWQALLPFSDVELRFPIEDAAIGPLLRIE
jgi:hypothetical protein